MADNFHPAINKGLPRKNFAFIGEAL